MSVPAPRSGLAAGVGAVAPRPLALAGILGKLPLRGYLGYIVRRLLAFIPLVIGISIVTFFLVRLLPGDPAQVLAGSTPYAGVVESIRERMGLDKPIVVQYVIYVRNALHGDFGDSWFSGKPVAEDMLRRAPATFELITYGMIVATGLGFFLGVRGAWKPGGPIDRIGSFYGFAAGGVPDFWLALLVIFVFFHLLQIIPPPIGRFPLELTPPPTVTGFLTIDALLAGDLVAFKAAAGHLVAPVMTLGIFFGGPIAKLTRQSMLDILQGDFIRYARACGLSEWTVASYAFRGILPPVLTLIGWLYAFLVGGAVLIETVFSWNGIGQYAVQSIINKDYAPVQAFVLLAGLFSLFVYLVLDLLYMLVDPRVRL
jgi:ABC-type dipeptide/oligopeptide/nickel transport system permease component